MKRNLCLSPISVSPISVPDLTSPISPISVSLVPVPVTCASSQNLCLSPFAPVCFLCFLPRLLSPLPRARLPRARLPVPVCRRGHPAPLVYTCFPVNDGRRNRLASSSSLQGTLKKLAVPALIASIYIDSIKIRWSQPIQVSAT